MELEYLFLYSKDNKNANRYTARTTLRTFVPMIHHLLQNKKLILGSQSPRRSQLLAELDLPFEKRVIETDESFSPDMDVHEVAEHIAINKALAHQETIAENEVIITADCVVVEGNEILGKPIDQQQAEEYLRRIAGTTHEVVSGVCIMDEDGYTSFSETATVKMAELSDQEIAYYISKYHPYDKAGAYGIQEWIGHAKIEWIKGTYTCIMGLPTRRLYEELAAFLAVDEE